VFHKMKQRNLLITLCLAIVGIFSFQNTTEVKAVSFVHTFKKPLWFPEVNKKMISPMTSLG